MPQTVYRHLCLLNPFCCRPSSPCLLYMAYSYSLVYLVQGLPPPSLGSNSDTRQQQGSLLASLVISELPVHKQILFELA